MRERGEELKITLKKTGDITAFLNVKERMHAESNVEAIRRLIWTWLKAEVREKEEEARKEPEPISTLDINSCRGCSSLTLGCTFHGFCPRKRG